MGISTRQPAASENMNGLLDKNSQLIRHSELGTSRQGHTPIPQYHSPKSIRRPHHAVKKKFKKMASPTSSRVALIFGVGSNVGAGLVKAFLGAGYRVATVSRSKPSSPPSSSTLSIQADLSDTSTVPGVFSQLSAVGWPAPSVVIWNAASVTRPAASDPENPLEVSLDGFDRDLALMVRSPYVAAREAVRAWKKAKEEGEREEEAAAAVAAGSRKGTFIMTGNLTPKKIVPVPLLVDLGVGKSAANYWVGLSDATFRKEGIR